MEVQEIVNSAGGIVRRHVGSEYRVLLFGSWARDTAVPRSDIDIGILGPAPLHAETLMAIYEEIDRLPTLRKIDVVDMCRLDAGYRETALSYAKDIG